MKDSGTSPARPFRSRRARAVTGVALLLLPHLAGPAFASEPPRAAYESCVHGLWPTADDAGRRVASCSQALQSGALMPDEVALARLTRGVARFMMGDRIVANDDYREALNHYDAAIDPRNPDAVSLYRRGVAFAGLGQTDKALADYSAAIGLEPGRAQAFLERGILLATSTRAYQRALDDFNRVLQLEPANVRALVVRGRTFSQLGRHAEAIADFNRALELAPTSSEAYHQRGLIHFRRNELALASRDYDAALRINPRLAGALVDRATLLAAERRYPEAVRDLDDALAVDPDAPLAYYNRGYARAALGEWDKAIADYSMAITLDPAMGIAFNNRCLARAVAGKELVLAMGDCDMALKLAPLSIDVRATRGLLFLKMGDPQLAIHEYDAALQQDPNHPAALYGRGLALESAGKVEEGRRNKAAGMALDPEVADAFSSFGVP